MTGIRAWLWNQCRSILLLSPHGRHLLPVLSCVMATASLLSAIDSRAEPPQLALDTPRLFAAMSDVDRALAQEAGLPLAMGVRIEAIVSSDANSNQGLRVGDILLLVNGRPIQSTSGLQILLAQSAGQNPVRFRVFRDGQETDVPFRWESPSVDQQLRWVRQSAQGGDPYNQALLGRLLLSASDKEGGRGEAIEWLKRSAVQGFRPAARALGDYFYGNQGAPDDGPAALEWYVKSLAEEARADRSDDAQSLYRAGLLLSQHPEITPDIPSAVRYWSRAAALQDARAWLALGRLLAQGRGIVQDHRKALECYRKSWELGHTPAAFQLGLACETGLGTEIDLQAAHAYYQAAADAGFPPAMTQLGLWHQFGTVVERDLEMARSWYRQAADLGEPMAMQQLGRLYEHGLGVTADRERAVAYYRQAAVGGQPEAHLALARLLDAQLTDETPADEMQAEEIVQHYRAAAEAGLSEAQVALGYLRLEGRHLDKDQSRALTWFQLAAQAGSASGAAALGTMYENGWAVQADRAEAIAWYLKAVDGGEAWAQSRLKELQEQTD